ncbi:HNH endonuclease [Pseudidiomarina sp. E22-M8]|uniref:HNH endonuclease n=1 Tax=Pseudidiomarina sp. E22-M8 TaxID=3424768 RepID=UPI00403D0E28
MWHQNNHENFAQKYRVSLKQVRWFQCTAEHVQARCDGGNNQSSNIVAACRLCNERRHRRPAPLDPEAYRALVTKQISRGKWLPNALVDQFKR